MGGPKDRGPVGVCGRTKRLGDVSGAGGGGSTRKWEGGTQGNVSRDAFGGGGGALGYAGEAARSVWRLLRGWRGRGCGGGGRGRGKGGSSRM